MPAGLAAHEYFMSKALEEAKLALEHNDVPIGAVIVSKNQVVAKGHNHVEKFADSTAHAELLTIKSALKNIGYKHLLDSTMYVTLEPCSMCAGAIVLARIKTLVFGAKDIKAGACGSVLNLVQTQELNHRVKLVEGVLEKECSELITGFFKDLRSKKKNDQNN